MISTQDIQNANIPYQLPMPQNALPEIVIQMPRISDSRAIKRVHLIALSFQGLPRNEN